MTHKRILKIIFRNKLRLIKLSAKLLKSAIRACKSTSKLRQIITNDYHGVHTSKLMSEMLKGNQHDFRSPLGTNTVCQTCWRFWIHVESNESSGKDYWARKAWVFLFTYYICKMVRAAVYSLTKVYLVVDSFERPKCVKLNRVINLDLKGWGASTYRKLWMLNFIK